MPIHVRLYRRLRFGRPITVVSGLPRSGTSMMMQMLAKGGLPIVTDGVRAADDSNPNGYFEHVQVMTLDKGGPAGWLRQARGKAVKIVSALLPHLPESHDYRVIFMHRSLDEVVRSQNLMLAGRGASGPAGPDDEGMREAYETHLQRIQNLLERRRCFTVLDVSYDGVMSRPLAEAQRISAFLGGGLDPVRMAAAVDPSLRRNRRDPHPSSS